MQKKSFFTKKKRAQVNHPPAPVPQMEVIETKPQLFTSLNFFTKIQEGKYNEYWNQVAVRADDSLKQLLLDVEEQVKNLQKNGFQNLQSRDLDEIRNKLQPLMEILSSYYYAAHNYMQEMRRIRSRTALEETETEQAFNALSEEERIGYQEILNTNLQVLKDDRTYCGELLKSTYKTALEDFKFYNMQCRAIGAPFDDFFKQEQKNENRYFGLLDLDWFLLKKDLVAYIKTLEDAENCIANGTVPLLIAKEAEKKIQAQAEADALAEVQAEVEAEALENQENLEWLPQAEGPKF